MICESEIRERRRAFREAAKMASHYVGGHIAGRKTLLRELHIRIDELTYILDEERDETNNVRS